MKKAMGVAAILILIVSAAAFAGVNANAKIAVHLEAHASRTCLKNFPSITTQGDIVNEYAGNDVDAFPVFFDMVEYQGFDYGMTWPGTGSCAFTSCSDLTIGTIQYAGDGVSHAWYVCQSSDIAVPGWAWIYEPAPARIQVVINPAAERILVGDCQDPAVKDTIPLSHSYYSGIAGEPGQPVQPTSWGQIKAMFK